MERQASDHARKNFDIKYTDRLVAGKNPVWFTSQGLRLEGNLYTPSGFDPNKRYPALVTSNPAGAVKEHSAGLYSEKLREHGYILLAFDNRSWGESEGFPRYTEDPFMKVE
ncbi:alpha/beta hydrolase, partial [bacterium]|nr:alpha/beta hydrolase [bacterium]